MRTAWCVRGAKGESREGQERRLEDTGVWGQTGSGLVCGYRDFSLYSAGGHQCRVLNRGAD